MKKIILIHLILILLVGCSAKSSYDLVQENSTAQSYPGVSYDMNYKGSRNADYTQPDYVETEEIGIDDKHSTQENQKLIKTGQITLEVDKVNDKYSEIEELLKDNEGYVYNLQEQNYYNRIEMSFTIKVKAENFEKLFNSLKEIGIVESSNINTEDVTTQYIDTEARIETLKVQEQSLLNIMSKAETVEDLLMVETELQRVRQQIESSEGQLKYFDNAVSYSVLKVSMIQEEIPTTVKDDKSIFEKFIFSLKDGLGFWTNVLFDIISSILWLLPLIVVIMLISYKPVKKFINKLKEKKTNKNNEENNH